MKLDGLAQAVLDLIDSTAVRREESESLVVRLECPEMSLLALAVSLASAREVLHKMAETELRNMARTKVAELLFDLDERQKVCGSKALGRAGSA